MAASNSHNDLNTGHVARLVGISPTVIRMWETLGRARSRRSANKPIALDCAGLGIYALTS